jgi:hypothetical protein
VADEDPLMKINWGINVSANEDRGTEAAGDDDFCMC